jgi:hypothetical protein
LRTSDYCTEYTLYIGHAVADGEQGASEVNAEYTARILQQTISRVEQSEVINTMRGWSESVSQELFYDRLD